MSGPGRPLKNPDEVRDVTSVKITRKNRDFIKGNGINLTEFLNKAIESVQGAQDYELKDLEKKILKLETDLTILRERHEQIQIRIQEQEEIRRSIEVRDKYEAHFMRKLYLEGKIQVNSPHIDYLSIVSGDQELLADMDLHDRYLLPKREKISRNSERILKNIGASKRERGYFIPEPKPYLSGSFEGQIDFEREQFVEDLLTKKIDRDSPVEIFLKYKPKILIPAVAERERKDFYNTLSMIRIEKEVTK
ncbi:MAG: hypothetical protein ACYDAO_10570 [Thermoplasmataceae archaeon]